MRYLLQLFFAIISGWLSFFLFPSLFAQDFIDNFSDDLLCQGVSADLKHPHYSDGVLTTAEGGVVTGPNLRIQARNITYTRKIIEGVPCCRLVAENDVMLEFNDYVFVGQKLEYDFQNRHGEINWGRSRQDPWFFGGERILIQPDGSYFVENGFVTTSEGEKIEWKITSATAHLYPNHDFSASQVKFKFFNTSLFWLPSLRINLDYIFDSPIRYSARWGGKQGPRAEFIYEIFSWNHWKTFLRADYRLTRGPGLGFETYYRSEDHAQNFEAINYIARDSSVEEPNQKIRFRFQGSYHHLLMNNRLGIDLSYDKLSDKNMATDYSDSGLDLEYTGMTRFQVRRQEKDWIANLIATVRINSFQSIKQELPTYHFRHRPFKVFNSGIISDSQAELSYLDYKYANGLSYAHDYRSARLEYLQRFYRPYQWKGVNFTPEIGAVGIYYSDVPQENKRWLLLGMCGFKANLPFSRIYGQYKHVVTPYLRYQHYTYPSSPPDCHYIFDIDDGWYRLNQLSFGVSQSFFVKQASGMINRALYCDFYLNALLNTKTLSQSLQKAYLWLTFNHTEFLRHTLDIAWDIAHQRVGHFNVRTDWTLSENLAVAGEFRYRDIWDWRKADHSNFILESYRNEKELLHSTLSDRRDTLLLHFFYRFHPNWALQLHSRHGWNRRQEPSYNELEVDLMGTIQSAWQVKLSYQHRERDHHRFTLGFNVGLARPDRWKCENLIPALNF